MEIFKAEEFHDSFCHHYMCYFMLWMPVKVFYKCLFILEYSVYTCQEIYVLQVPVNYSVEFIMVAGDTITGTLQQWGQMLRTYYGKDDHYRNSDFSINYLG